MGDARLAPIVIIVIEGPGAPRDRGHRAWGEALGASDHERLVHVSGSVRTARYEVLAAFQQACSHAASA